MTTSGPAAALDRDDPGDDTQLRFRYQHGYGVILLCAATTGAQPYVAIWCEHHEDLLGEKPTGNFDSFQVKTATPESGPWRMSSEPLVKSIGRFVELDRKFPGRIDDHYFVSNVRCFDTEKEDEVGRSPIRFFTSIQNSATPENLPDSIKDALKTLASKLKCTESELFATCARVRIPRGPALDGFEASIAHEHLPKVDGCAKLTAFELNGLRDELMQKVFNASSLAVEDPSKHWCCVLGDDHLSPTLRAKRLQVANAIADTLGNRGHVFRFLPSGKPLLTAKSSSDLKVLTEKLNAGGVVGQVDSMVARTVSTEGHLLGLVAQNAEEAQQVVIQLTTLVGAACSDAEAMASASPEPWGLDMYRRLLVRLTFVAEQQPELVYGKPIDCLMGVAGLLTEDCTVWWSPRFDLKGSL